jgi:hypothetical protein
MDFQDLRRLAPFFNPHLPVDWHNPGFVLKAKLMDQPTSRNQANDFVAKYFGFEHTGTTLGREVVAGLTTFVTMSYIIVVNPAILKAAGIPVEPSMVATIAIAVFGTLLMGIYANRPFAIAPYMGENAFLAYTVVEALGFRWPQALAAVFLAGVAFFLLTLFRIRQWLRSNPRKPAIEFRRQDWAFSNLHWTQRDRNRDASERGRAIASGASDHRPGASRNFRFSADFRADDPPLPCRNSCRDRSDSAACLCNSHCTGTKGVGQYAS